MNDLTVYDYLFVRGKIQEYKQKQYIDSDFHANPSYDHIFINGTATAKRFTMLSDSYMNAMSDHYPIYADLEI